MKDDRRGHPGPATVGPSLGVGSSQGVKGWYRSLTGLEKLALAGLAGWIVLTTTYLRAGADQFLYLALAVVGLEIVLSRRRPDLGGRTGVWLLLLGAAAVLTTPTSIWLGRSVGEVVELSKLIVIFFLTVHVLRPGKTLRYALGLTVVLLAFFPAVGSIQAYLAGAVEVAGRAGWTGYFRNANLLAAVLVLFLPLPVVWIRTSRRLSHRLFWSLCAGLMAVGILLSGSRSGTLGFAVVGLWAVWSSRDRLRAVAVMVALAVVLLGFGPEEWRARVGTMAYAVTGQQAPETRTGDVTNWENRVLIWRAGMEAVKENPLLGTGPGTFEEAHKRYQDPFLWTGGRRWKEAHNAYLRVWVEMGLVGLVAFLGLLISVVRRGVGELRRLRSLRVGFGQDALLLGGMLAGLAGFLVSNLFNTLTYLWYFYFFLGALTVVMRQARKVGIEVASRMGTRRRATGGPVPRVRTPDESSRSKSGAAAARGR